MNREGLQESLSAVMDNEATELELRRVIVASDDVSVRATWSRYQVARAAMHGELRDPSLDLVTSVSAALAQESAPKLESRRFGWLSQVAVAATVTLAVLAGVRFYAGGEEALAPAQLAGSEAAPVQQEAVLVGYSGDDAEAAAEVAPQEPSPWLLGAEKTAGGSSQE